MRNCSNLLWICLLWLPLRAAAQQPRADTVVLRDTIPPAKNIQLKEITVKGNTPAVRMKGDTVEYNAAKFKTKENAVVEDLLRKLPGVNINKDGSIKAQGQTVQRILVDGKEFFGSDPAIATRNLPADMIEKVQVLDKQSDMEEFTGVADGKQIKTINLVTKMNRKRGYFGNASAGAGTSGRYEGGINASSFVNDMQLSVLLKGNNVNKSGFSATELIRMVSNNPDMFNNLPPVALSELMRMKGVKIEGSTEALAEIARPIGLTDTRFGGVNFNNDWGRQLKLRSSYFFNETNTHNNYDYARQYRLKDTSYNYQQTGTTDNHNINQRIDLSAETMLSERTTLKILPHIDLNTFDNRQSKNFYSHSADGSQLLNEGTQLTTTKGHNRFGNMDIQLRHKTSKPGRTLAINIKPEYYENHTTLLNQASSKFYNLPQGKQTEKTDQQTVSDNKVYSANGSIVYTTPLSGSHSLQLGQQLYYSHGEYDRQAKDRNPENDHYELPDARYSDAFTTEKWQYTSKVSLAGGYRRFRYTAGIGWQQSRIQGTSVLKDYRIHERYNALLPELYAELKTNSRQKLTFRYNTIANTPSVTQMQPLDDNTDPLYIRKGNPLLDQEKSQRWSLSFNNIDPQTGNALYTTANFTWYNSQITDSTSIDITSGKQLIIPVNVKGNYEASLNAGKSITVGQNNSSISAGLSVSYARNTIFNNGLPNDNNTFSITPDVNINYYPVNKLSVAIRGSASWNVRRFSALAGLPEKNWLLTYGVETNLILPFNMTLETSLDGFSALGLAAGFNNNIFLLNAALNKEINKQFSLQASARDLLNNNAGINRITGSGYIEDRKNNALGQYFMLSVFYKFRHFPKSKNK